MSKVQNKTKTFAPCLTSYLDPTSKFISNEIFAPKIHSTGGAKYEIYIKVIVTNRLIPEIVYISVSYAGKISNILHESS